MKGFRANLKTYFKNRQKYFPCLIAIFISIYALYLRLFYLAQHELWADEIWQLGAMQGSFIDLLKWIPKNQYCSYLCGDFYLIYPFFKIFSYEKWGLAIPHIAATILGFYILYLICKLYFKTLLGYIITFSIVCFNSTLIKHATEIRTYAVLPTLALAVFYFSQQLANQNIKMSIRKKWMIGIFFILVIWFDVYGASIVFLSVIFSLFSKYDDEYFKIILKYIARFMAIVFCIAMPVWFFCVFGPHYNWRQCNINTFDFIPNPLVNLIGFLKGIFGNLIGCKKLYFLLIGIIMPFIVPYEHKSKQIAFLVIMVFLPIGLVFTNAVVLKYWFIQRTFIWVMPFFALFLGWSWDSLFIYLKGKIKKCGVNGEQ